MLKYLLPLGLFVGLLILLGVGLTLNPREVPSPLIGKPAPQFNLPRLDDPQASFDSARFQGKVSLFNVWASWCVACRQEHAFLMQLARQGVTIYGLDYKDTREAGLQWIERLGNPYQAVAFDAAGKVAIDWGVYGVPETFVIDKQGVIRYKHIGPITPRDWEEKLGPLVAYLEKQS
ncbi:cytochrome c biogenesis protein CcmG, thiol:disulfide interchange protein DsbE [Methylomarinovum tepidoasis]|uniref:Cytochrome c biogenesis protein CcmG, thiol:disulfide interchange protein DsbE n=1 Tax=Methylomarinovum tepidoasis TaxID=2840183 RepID=A0AAU9CR70_9GAMM|nr:DsbE family thiol:disulfide interchange protein [Methylomarinovum sp. IN45]BCX88878.1 cytochrome c biogenesis protein CcmG, thiol:disulfide interchange protein DsbE [Methylomarinovum sp. IN45]